MTTTSLRSALFEACGHGLTLVEAVVVISRIPYGRPTDRTARGVLAEWRGTCSTKHLLLAEVVNDGWPKCRPELWHRVYRVTPGLAAQRWGEAVAATVPPEGLVDVHTFATLLVDGDRRVRVDVTMPLAGWDGGSDIRLACGPGDDEPAGDDPMATKASLVAEHCDVVLRERFIAALSEAT